MIQGNKCRQVDQARPVQNNLKTDLVMGTQAYRRHRLIHGTVGFFRWAKSEESVQRKPGSPLLVKLQLVNLFLNRAILNLFLKFSQKSLLWLITLFAPTTV